MTTEAVTYIIDAEDIASAKIRKVSDDIERQAGRVETVGKKSRVAGQLLGSMLGGQNGALASQLAGQIGDVTDQVSSLSKASKLTSATSLTMIASVGAAGFALGNTIGNAIFETKKWKNELKEAQAAMRELADDGVALLEKRWEQAQERIGLLIDPDEQKAALAKMQAQIQTDLGGADEGGVLGNLKAAKENLEALQSDSLLGFQTDNHKARIEAEKENVRELKKRRDVLKDLRDEYLDQNSARAKELQLMKLNKEAFESRRRQAIEAKENSRAFVESLRNEVDLLEQKKLTQKELRDLLVLRNTQGGDTREALRLFDRKNALKAQFAAEEAAQKKNEAAQAKKEAAQKRQQELLAKERREKERVLSLQKSQADNLLLQAVQLRDGGKAASALRLQMQGVGAGAAGRIADIQGELNKLNSTNSIGINTSDERLISGAGKQAEDALRAQQAVERNKLLDELLKEIIELRKQRPIIQVENIGT